MKATQQIRIERRDGIVRVVLDRPPLNILDITMLEELDAALGEIAVDDAVRVVVLTGAGRAFCAGIDIADHMGDRVRPMLDIFHSVIGRLLSLKPPVVAAVNGAALGGGCELLLACDLVLARDGAKLGQPEIRLGVFPPAAAALLPSRIGIQRTLDLILTGRTFTAAEGCSLGLVSRVIAADDFDAGVDAIVSDLASLSPPVVRLAKRAALVAATSDVDRLEAAELLYANELVQLDDATEGLTAFLEKRPPAWKGV